MTKRCIHTLVVFLLLVSVVGCGSKGTGAQAELDTIDAIMQQAIDVGAADLAPVELRIAREKQRRASAAMKAKKYSKAEKLGREAKVDAQFAGALAKAVKSRHALEGVYDGMFIGPDVQVEKTSISESESLRALIGG